MQISPSSTYSCWANRLPAYFFSPTCVSLSPRSATHAPCLPHPHSSPTPGPATVPKSGEAGSDASSPAWPPLAPSESRPRLPLDPDPPSPASGPCSPQRRPHISVFGELAAHLRDTDRMRSRTSPRLAREAVTSSSCGAALTREAVGANPVRRGERVGLRDAWQDKVADIAQRRGERVGLRPMVRRGVPREDAGGRGQDGWRWR